MLCFTRAAQIEESNERQEPKMIHQMTISIERLKDIAAEDLCGKHNDGVRCSFCDGILMARELLDKRWKSIKKEPNPESVPLLTGRPDNVLGKSVRTAFQTTSYEWCDDGQVIVPRWEPTHWMHLPEPPMEGI